jgi:ribosomal protein L11 methylase PrmA
MELWIIVYILAQIIVGIVFAKTISNFKRDLVWFSGILIEQKTEICKLYTTLHAYRTELDKYYEKESCGDRGSIKKE